jgi:predicted ribosomally synthesized peptide with nif11-like leader
MSTENLNSFRLALANDKSLQAGLRAASGVGDGNAVPMEAFLSFAAAKGYDISAADLESMEEELSDEALDRVAGGVGGLSGQNVPAASRRGGWIIIESPSMPIYRGS